MKNYFLLLATALVTMSAGAQKVEMSVELMQPAQKVAVANQQIQISHIHIKHGTLQCWFARDEG